MSEIADANLAKWGWAPGPNDFCCEACRVAYTTGAATVRICRNCALQREIGYRAGVAAERERCADIALAIDSGRGNEKEIAVAIREPASQGKKRPQEIISDETIILRRMAGGAEITLSRDAEEAWLSPGGERIAYSVNLVEMSRRGLIEMPADDDELDRRNGCYRITAAGRAALVNGGWIARDAGQIGEQKPTSPQDTLLSEDL